MKGLKEPLKGLIKAFDPPTLQDAIKRVLTLEDCTLPRTKQVTPYHGPSMGAPFKKDTSPPRRDLSSGKSTLAPPITYTRTKDERNEINELRRNNLCYSCNQPWTSCHRCLGKGALH